MTTIKEWTLTYEAHAITVNAARRIHWTRRAEHDTEWVKAGHDLALANKIPTLARCTILWVHERKNRAHMPDTVACLPSAKAFLDGLVAAGVLADDDPEHVTAQSFTVSITGRSALTCVITGEPAVTP